MVLDDNRRARPQRRAQQPRPYREAEAVHVGDLDRVEMGRHRLPHAAETVLDAVARDGRAAMKALQDDDAGGARLEKRLAPAGQRRVPLQ